MKRKKTHKHTTTLHFLSLCALDVKEQNNIRKEKLKQKRLKLIIGYVYHTRVRTTTHLLLLKQKLTFHQNVSKKSIFIAIAL